MQLDKTFIAIRERDFLEILDLSLQVIRTFFAPLVTALLCGIVPVAFFCHWVVMNSLGPDDESGWRAWYTFDLALLVVLTMPLAAAPATLFLGQATFLDKPRPMRVARDFFASLPQLVLFQGLLRTVLLLPVFTSFLPFSFWPYLGEIVLLERNPLFRGKAKRITTMRRASALHNGSGGELFGRWVASAVLGAGLTALMVAALWSVRQWVTGIANLDQASYVLYLQLSIWTVVGYFAVVRFLSYLDLRIRREGWEVELKMRAEATRLESELV